jgi:hypothetical protein
MFLLGIVHQFFYPRMRHAFRLPCNIEGLTATSPVVWYKGSTRFQPVPGRVRIVGSDILFQPAIAEDSGTYSCVATDTMETVRADLHVNGDSEYLTDLVFYPHHFYEDLTII